MAVADILSFSALPVLRFPLPQLWEAMKCYFSSLIPPSVEEVANALEVSGGSNSPLRRLFRALQTAEVRCIEHQQKNRGLTGPLPFNIVCFHILNNKRVVHSRHATRVQEI